MFSTSDMGTGCPSTLAGSPSITTVYGWIARLVDCLIIKDEFFKNGVGLTISGLGSWLYLQCTDYHWFHAQNI